MSKKKENNNWTKVHNNVLEALYSATDFTSTQLRLLLFVSRRTHGFKKSRMRMTRKDLAIHIGTNLRTLERSFDDLVDRKVIELHDAGAGNRPAEFGINGKVSQWVFTGAETGNFTDTTTGKSASPAPVNYRSVDRQTTGAETGKLPVQRPVKEIEQTPEKPDNQASGEESVCSPKETLKENFKENSKEKGEDRLSLILDARWTNQIENAETITKEEALAAADRMFLKTFARMFSYRDREKIELLISVCEYEGRLMPGYFVYQWIAACAAAQEARALERAAGQKSLDHVLTDVCNHYARISEAGAAQRIAPKPPASENWSQQAREERERAAQQQAANN